MAERVWDRYLTEQDRAHLAMHPAKSKARGTRPALLMVDLYRQAFGDEPQPLLESVKTWPSSCGLAAWQSLPNIERLLAEARALGVPVVHVTGLEGMPGWHDENPRGGGKVVLDDANDQRKFDIVDELAPVEGEVALRKIGPSAFWGTPLVGLLRTLDVDTVVVAGESTSGCVRATVVDAKTYRYNVIVPEECVFDRHEATHAMNLFDMDQKYANVEALEAVIEYLRRVRRAETAA